MVFVPSGAFASFFLSQEGMDGLLHEDKHMNTGYTEYIHQAAIQEHLLQYRVFHMQMFLTGMFHLPFL